jgi:hypothetical protein
MKLTRRLKAFLLSDILLSKSQNLANNYVYLIPKSPKNRTQINADKRGSQRIHADQNPRPPKKKKPSADKSVDGFAFFSVCRRRTAESARGKAR